MFLISFVEEALDIKAHPSLQNLLGKPVVA